MADFENSPQDEYENYDAENGMDNMEEEGVEYEYEYIDDDGNPVEDGGEEGVEYEYVGEGAEEESVEYLEEDTDLPDGMTTEGVVAEGGETVEETFEEDTDAGDENEEETDTEKPKSFFGKLAESTPYEVMIWLSFFILLIGIMLMLFKWMGYDMIVYPKY